MNVAIRNLTHRFGPNPVLRNVSLEVADRELFFLLGPSGCGKTTLLRLIAGFYQPDQGEIWFGERRIDGVEPHRRNTGMVFQNYALWPHLTVAQNVAYGLEVRGLSAQQRRERVEESLRTVHMESLADRSPNQLSGGQQQRVALARALVVQPDVLLLDEPLSNLDARLRLEMRDEIRRIHDQTRITTIYVTHDQKEALSMADRMAVMRDGVVEQLAPPRDVYRQPSNRFVADFIGEANWLAGTIARPANHSGATPPWIVVETGVGPFHVSPEATRSITTPGKVHLGFRPEAIRWGGPGPNQVETLVEQVIYLGDTEQYLLRLADGTRIRASQSDPDSHRSPGDRVPISLPPDRCFVLPG